MTVTRSASKRPLETFQPGLATIFARVAIGAAGAPTVEAGTNFTIANTGVGLYTITLDRKYRGLMFLCATLEEADGTGDDLVVKVRSETVATTGQILISVLAATAETNPASGAKLRFMIVLEDNAVT